MKLSLLPPELRDRIDQHRRQFDSRWLRLFARIWIGLTAITLLGAITIAALFNTAGFHGYLIRTIEQQASESLGTRVHLQNFALHLTTLSTDLYGITVDGTSPHLNPPILQVNHVEASVRVVSILHRAWYFDDLHISRPIVQIFVDDHGVSNIPVLKSNGNSSTSVFDLGIRHALLDEGEVYYNSRQSTLAVDLHDVEFRSSFDKLFKQYSGTLRYSNGHLAYGAFRPLPHSLEASFVANPNAFRLSNCNLTVGASHLALTASLQNYNSPEVQVHYDLAVDGSQMAKLFSNPSIPTGIIQTSGAIRYHQYPNYSGINSLQVRGDLGSKRLNLNMPSFRTEIADVTGHYSLMNGNFAIQDIHASVLGGEVIARGTMNSVGGESNSTVNASVRGVSLANVARAFGASSKGFKVTVSGKLNADARASWGKSLDDLVAHADAVVEGQVAGPSVASVRASRPPPDFANNSGAGPALIPVNSRIYASFAAKDRQLTLDKSYLRAAHTNVTINGTLSKRSNLNLGIQVGDIRELETIASIFSPQSLEHPSQLHGLAGSASFQGTVNGSTTTPHLTGRLIGSNLQVKGTDWKTLRTDVDVSPSLASLQHADLEPASHGRITFNAKVGLANWSLLKTSPIQIDASASQLNITELTKLASQQLPITGDLNATVALHGTEANPVGNGNISLTNIVAYEQPIHSAKVTFSGDGQEVKGDLSVQLPAGDIQGNATVRPADKTYIAKISANGIQLDRMRALKARNISMSGTLTLDAKGQGSFDNLGLDATVRIPTLVAQSQTIKNFSLSMKVADHMANALLTSSALNTSIQARAKIALSGDYSADVSLDSQGIPLQPLIAVYAPDRATTVTGQTEVHATLHGPLKKRELVEAHVNIPVLKLAYGNSIQLAATSPIRADYKNGVVEIQRSSISGTDTNLQFQGSIPTSGQGPMSLLLQGTVNLQLAQLFDPDMRSSGQIRFNIDSNGAADASDIGGEIDIVDANFASADLPVGLQHGNGVLKVTKDRVNISNFQAAVGGGTLTAQGGVAYRPALQFNLGVATKGVRVLYPQGMRESVDADLRLAGTTDSALLGGSVNLSDLSFTPAFDLTTFISQFSGGATAPPSPGIAQNVQLNIALRSSNNVNLVSRTLSIGGSANLQVRGTAADPVLLGRVNLNDGDIILNGNRYVLNGGTIQFINPAETQPVVNLSLNTNIQQYSIDIRFQGPVDQLRTEYNSDPALPSADIIHLLAFGNTTEANATASGSMSTTQTGESLVASQVSSQVTSRVSKIAGISQLSISPVLAGSSSQGPPGAVITIQQRVTGNLFVNFSTNVASTQSQTIQGQYKLSPRVSVSATRDPNGGFGFDALIKKSW